MPGGAPHALPSQLLHDLRTPLHQIIGYVEMLTEQAEDEGRADVAADLQKVRGASSRLLALFDRNLTAQAATPAPFAASAPPSLPASSPLLASASGFSAPPLAAPMIVAARPLLSAEAFGGEGLASGAEAGRVLVVDDNETNRDLLAHMLRRQKFQIEMASDGVSALEQARASEFDLILLDIMMPLMDGYEVLTRLKSDAATRHVPVIMISAVGEVDSVVRCIELGADDYLPKPFNPTLLKARIGACLEKKRGRDREMRLFAQLQENFGRLQSLEKMRDDLTHMIVHDLRTPLSSLLAGLQTMPMVQPLHGAQQECFEIAMRGGHTLLGMINDLLDISKMEAGQMELSLSAFPIPALLDDACEQVAASARLNHLVLRQEVEPDLPFLRGDEDKLRRTLVNLIGNAIKFTPHGGTVTVGARALVNEGASADQNGTLFWVRDTGEGIPAEDFARIFDKFAQVEERRAGRSMSTGLGLALCKMVVEAHGGQIRVESEIGQGSTFSFIVPTLG